MTEEKKGFKRTEVGVFPEDWTIVPLDVLVSYTNGKAHEQSIDEAGQYIVVNSKFISTEGEVKKFTSEDNCPANVDDILMVMSDVPNGRAIAKCFYVDQNDKYTVNQRICLLNAQNVDSRLLFYILNRNKYYLAFDDGVKQTNLRKDDVLNCPIPLPPTLEEQQAIASALSDVDELIRSLDGLIQKKQAIKKGTMQQLLSGKKRLPGFDGEWEVKKIGEIVDVDPENLSSSTNPYYEFEYLSLEDVNRGVIKSKTKHRYADSPSRARRVLRKGDVGFGTVRPTNQSHFLIENEVDDLICSTGFAVMRTQKKVMISEYLFYSLFTYQINEQVNQIIAGSNYPAVNSRDVKNLKLNHPKDIEEQKAIAQILSDMDRELQTLRQKREKYVQIKQGMMQELLTGRVRLIAD